MNPGSIDTSPLEINDFSGGITDNVLQGDPKRSEKLDNFDITVDKKLQERNGTIIYDPTAYQISGNTSRISQVFTGINESLLFSTVHRNIYTQLPGPLYNTAWSAILGPTGNEAISGGGQYSQLGRGEFQHQVYYTASEGSLPGKIFQDHTGTWKAVTAGIPKMKWTPNYTDASLLAACIALANDLRSSFISHMEDVGVLETGQHFFLDKYSLCYLKTEVFNGGDPENPGPSPLPTPAPAASTQATLFALCLALSLSYEHHRNDLAGTPPSTESGAKLYHFDTILPYPFVAGGGTDPKGLGINAKLTRSGVVTSLANAALFLDDLAQKWYWHQLSPFSHSLANSNVLMSRYLTTAPKIGTIYSTPYTIQVTPNYNEFIAFAQFIKLAWNKHANGTGVVTGNQHSQVDIYGPITLSDASNFDSSALTIFWARWIYGYLHMTDANVQIHSRCTFNSTSGNDILDTFTKVGTATVLDPPVNTWIVKTSNWVNGGVNDSKAARVTAAPVSVTGTVDINKNATSTVSTQTAMYSDSWLHSSYVSGIGTDCTTSRATAAEFLTATGYGAIGTDLATWISLGSEFLLALAAHTANANVHFQGYNIGSDLVGVNAVSGNPFFVPDAASIVYASFYRYTYTVEPNGILYVNEGPPVFSGTIDVTKIYPVGTVLPPLNSTYFSSTVITQENSYATITGIPILVNDTITNYDTTVSVVPKPTTRETTGYNQNLTIEIYKTTDGGNTYYFEESLTNGTISYTDKTNESYPRVGEDALNLRQVMYTSGGVLANDPPPFCKYIHAFGGAMYYGAVTDTGQYFPNRIVQSNVLAPDSAPATFNIDLDDELAGISSTRTNVIALCKNSLSRISGVFSSTGQGGMLSDKIADSMGCLNSGSIVKTELGIFYAGTDGFYFTDGYQFIKISLEFDKTYRDMTSSDTQKSRIMGKYDKLTRRVYWAMTSQSSGTENDQFFVFYLNYGVKPSGVFTKAMSKNSWLPASFDFYKGKLIIGDSRGYFFKASPYAKTDPYINTATAASLWKTQYIPYEYLSCSMDFGTVFKRKWVTKIHVTGKNTGNVALQIEVINDAGTFPSGASSTLPLAVVQYIANQTWGDPTIKWDEGQPWKYDGALDAIRRFPSKTMRSSYKQLRFTPADVVVYKSDNAPLFAFSNVDAVAKTAALLTTSGYENLLWPKDVLDYYISFSTDGYDEKYLVTALDATKKIITYSDADNLSTTDAKAKWQISGVKKEQRINISAMALHYGFIGDEFKAYPGPSAAGGIGGNS